MPTPRDPKRFHVGQTVTKIDSHSHSGRPAKRESAQVVKIGRTLVTVRVKFGLEQVFRIETGWARGEFEHCFIRTDDELAEEDAVADATAALKVLGIRVEMFQPRSEFLRAVHRLANSDEPVAHDGHGAPIYLEQLS